MTAAGDPQPERQKAHRLTFRYRDRDVTLIANQVVEVIPPPGDPPERDVPAGAFSVSLYDTAGNTLYRRLRGTPLHSDKEVFGPEPDRSLYRVPVDTPEGTFTLLVPHLPGDATVELAEHVPSTARPPSEARVIGRYPLHNQGA
jgi:hypothetical protein